MANPIQAVVFDIDGVLLDSFEANFVFYQNLMLQTGYPLPTREVYQSVFHLTMWDAIKQMTGSHDEAEVRSVWEFARNRGVPYPVERLRLSVGVEGVIKELSRKYRLGIVTSRIQESIFESPQMENLRGYFSVVVSYLDTKNHKPHPEPLLLAAQKLGVEPASAVYIGDVENDLKAARAADMFAIIYSKTQCSEADACTSTFAELPSLISRL